MKRADIERCRAAGESIRDDAQAIKRAVRTLAATVLFLLCPIPLFFSGKFSIRGDHGTGYCFVHCGVWWVILGNF